MKIKLKKLIPVVMFVFPAIFTVMARTAATELTEKSMTDPTVISTNVTLRTAFHAG